MIGFADFSGDYAFVWGTEYRYLAPDLRQYITPILMALIGAIALIGILNLLGGRSAFRANLNIKLFLVFWIVSTLFGAFVGLARGNRLDYVIGDARNIVLYLALFAINDTNSERGLKHLQTLFLTACGIILLKLALSIGSDLLMGYSLSWRYLFKASSFLSPMMLLALSLLIHSNQSVERRRYLLAFILATVGVLTAQMRGIFLGTFAGSLVLFALLVPKQRVSRFILAGILVLVLGIILGLTVQGDITRAFGYWGSETSYYVGVNYRIRQADMLMHMFSEHPLTGQGLGALNPYYEGYRDWLPRPYLLELEYLNLLAKLGIVGFGLFVAAFLFLFRECVTLARSAPAANQRGLVGGLTAGLVSLMVQSGTNTLYSSVLFHVYVVIILLVLSATRTLQEHPQQSLSSA